MVYDGQSLISSYSLLLAEIVGAIDCTSVRHADCTTARHADCTMKSPLGCATLLPVKILQKFGDGKMFLKSDQIFTGKSVAQVSVPSYYLGTEWLKTVQGIVVIARTESYHSHLDQRQSVYS